MEKEESSDFRRKVYTRMYNSSMSLLKADQDKPRKKIVPTTKKSGLREEFKKTFLPLLIDVFELRQMSQNFKARKNSPLFSSSATQKSPIEIIKRLETLQNDIEESKRWCEGVILQISKGIEEAKEALQFIDHSSEIKEVVKEPSLSKPSFFDRLKKLVFSRNKGNK